jgi:decaprenylphospho-beta-D-erythro-pentofuranosid-2-ulose 2-reductase
LTMHPRQGRRALLIGATSDISRRLAHLLAADGIGLILAARDCARLAPDKADLELRYRVGVELLEIDLLDPAGTRAALLALDPVPEIAVSLVGEMGNQAAQQDDPALAARAIAANFTGPALALETLAGRALDADVPAVLVGVSSVAGDRGRARNYYYGAAKAGFTAFLSGLRQRLAATPVTVITVKPGFVATRMTQGMDLPAPLVDSAETCARLIKRAIDRKRLIAYPWKWRLLMLAVRAIPEKLFRKLKF